ncbi:MAG: helix-turn-helix transcriptional regulator [Clostridia bacterium]|nr:helix-turn-helix transcriptional regulator [Clostridia bacterium]
MMEKSFSLVAGERLRQLIKEYYSSQEEFALDYPMDLRTVSRYVNNGITRIDTIQELAEFFKVPFITFFEST